jgi:hypothetical protein
LTRWPPIESTLLLRTVGGDAPLLNNGDEVASGAELHAVDYCLIQVPYHAGDDRHPSCAGPGRMVEAGAADLLAA